MNTTLATLEQDACDFLKPLTASAYSSRQFAQAREAFRNWLDARGYVPTYNSYINDMGHGLWEDEEAAKVNEAEGARLGMTDADLKERFVLMRDLPYAQSQDDVDDMRFRVEDWLYRFPDDSYGAGWRTFMREKQDLLDLLADVGAPAPTPPSKQVRDEVRAARPDKSLIGV